MNNLLKFLLFILICLVSVIFTLSRYSYENLKGDNGFLDASEYGVSYFDNSGLSLLTLTPLNDNYYQYDHKEHLLTKINESRRNDVVQKIKNLTSYLSFENKKFFWNASGYNSKNNKVEIKYLFLLDDNQIEIEREVFSKNFEITNYGSVLKICTGCFISDDKNRLYINASLINEDKIKIASRTNKILFAVGPNQSFPEDVSKIYILDSHGIVFAEIDSINREIYYDENWNMIEFKSRFDLTKYKFKTKQNIKLMN